MLKVGIYLTKFINMLTSKKVEFKEILTLLRFARINKDFKNITLAKVNLNINTK